MQEISAVIEYDETPDDGLVLTREGNRVVENEYDSRTGLRLNGRRTEYFSIFPIRANDGT